MAEVLPLRTVKVNKIIQPCECGNHFSCVPQMAPDTLLKFCRLHDGYSPFIPQGIYFYGINFRQGKMLCQKQSGIADGRSHFQYFLWIGCRRGFQQQLPLRPAQNGNILFFRFPLQFLSQIRNHGHISRLSHRSGRFPPDVLQASL